MDRQLKQTALPCRLSGEHFSIRVQIDMERAQTRQSLAEWIEEAAREKLARKGKE